MQGAYEKARGKGADYIFGAFGAFKDLSLIHIYPRIITFYTEPDALMLGASTIELGDNTFGIYDKEQMSIRDSGIPGLDSVDASSHKTQVIILSPTRELALSLIHI